MISHMENNQKDHPSLYISERLEKVLPECFGGDAPDGVSRVLQMDLQKENEMDNIENYESGYETHDASDDLIRVTVERDIYKHLYEELLAKLLK